MMMMTMSKVPEIMKIVMKSCEVKINETAMHTQKYSQVFLKLLLRNK